MMAWTFVDRFVRGFESCRDGSGFHGPFFTYKLLSHPTPNIQNFSLFSLEYANKQETALFCSKPIITRSRDGLNIYEAASGFICKTRKLANVFGSTCLRSTMYVRTVYVNRAGLGNMQRIILRTLLHPRVIRLFFWLDAFRVLGSVMGSLALMVLLA